MTVISYLINSAYICLFTNAQFSTIPFFYPKRECAPMAFL